MKNFPLLRSLVAAALVPCAAAASVHPQQVADIADLSLEQLTAITVTSAARREQRQVEAAASIYVITAADIRRSGATSLPEVLRLAPNLQVMRADTSQYVISARGGLTTTANKMLVLVDGRTIYTPLFSGVFYDAVVSNLEDIDRVEVISGPGSTLWGTNAVNGVINVISKKAAETRGGLLTAAAGEAERGGSLRYGWGSPSGAIRAYARHYDRDPHRLASGASARDDSERSLLGVRGDWERGRDTTMVQAEAYRADVGNLAGARDMQGGHVLGRWSRALAGGGALSLQGYYDRTEREHAGTFSEKRDTLDLELQHTFAPAPRHRLAWGAAHRSSRDHTPPTPALGFVPERRTLQLTSLYAQDELELGERTRLTLGLRAERNSYTGVEWLPNARVSYSLAPAQFVWAALTRTVRSPSRLDRDIVAPGRPPFAIVNNDTFESEVANVVEIGYRGNLTPAASLSLTAFHHDFTRLRTGEPAAAGGLMLANAGRGRIEGLEGWGDLRPSPDLRIAWGFTLMR
ncbi:MAG TPA: TonB-dependent receptor, partial [Albitalea sp.]